MIGTDITGESRLTSTGLQNGNGVNLVDGSSDNTIGGTTAAARNIISGNADTGVYIGVDEFPAPYRGNVVEGNYIGTDAPGTAALANAYDGVELDTGASGNTIGGTTAAARNIISANPYAGVEIDDANDNVVEGDFIGTDVTGTAALGNGARTYTPVVFLSQDSASANTIGGLTASPGTGAGNLISGNIGSGVVFGSAGPNNLVAGNLIGTDVTGRSLSATTTLPRAAAVGLASTSTTRPTPSWVSRAAAT